MSAAPIRVPANSRLAQEAIARLAGGKDRRGKKAFDLIAGLADQPKAPKAPKPRKYLNTKVKDEDGTFDSLTEHRRWGLLKLRQKAGEIRGLRNQVKFDLIVNGELVCTYTADAVYAERQADGSWMTVVEDTKSPRTRKIGGYRIKNKLMWAVHRIRIREV